MNGADEHIFWVFGRRTEIDPFEQVGVVKASSETIAYVYARMNYTERPWRDLCVVPRDSFYGVRRSTDDPVALEQSTR